MAACSVRTRNYYLDRFKVGLNERGEELWELPYNAASISFRDAALHFPAYLPSIHGLINREEIESAVKKGIGYGS